ncbi:hypothetical protein IG631_01840 [Alternaria alternata]|nr:hypothetical protein IG631_01840 [Alternaria alternata]
MRFLRNRVLSSRQPAIRLFAHSSSSSIHHFCASTARLSNVLSFWHLCVKCQAQTKNGEQCVRTIRLRSALSHYTGSGEGVLPGRTIPKEESTACGAFSRRFVYRIAITESLISMRTALLCH